LFVNSTIPNIAKKNGLFLKTLKPTPKFLKIYPQKDTKILKNFTTKFSNFLHQKFFKNPKKIKKNAGSSRFTQ